MIHLNLSTSNKAEEKIKAYLEENASTLLATKINEGVHIFVDAVELISRKSLKSFMEYAKKTAQEQAAKGSQYACIEDDVVYGWAMHYFQEDTIQGELFNLDGTPYKKPEPVKPYTPPVQPVKKEPQKTQYSIFDMMMNTEEKAEEKTVSEVKQEEIKPAPEVKRTIIRQDNYDVDEETGEILSDEDIKEDIEIAKEMEAEPIKKVNPLYSRYLNYKNQYQGVIALRLGDFYEVLGKDATVIAEELDLTLTGRDFGLSERVPMVGFPYHCKEQYFDKIVKTKRLFVAENDTITEYKNNSSVPEIEEDTDDFDIEAEKKHTAECFDKDVMITLYDLLGDKMDIA